MRRRMTSWQLTDGALPCAKAVNIEVSHDFWATIPLHVGAYDVVVHTCVDAIESVVMN